MGMHGEISIMSNKKLRGKCVVWPAVRVPLAFNRIVVRVQRESGFRGQLLELCKDYMPEKIKKDKGGGE